jgi:mRNA interferase RelE/StbE
MASFKIEWKPSAVKELRHLPKEMISRIVRAVEQLAQNPFPRGSKKLVGSRHTYRIREGHYRIVYDVATNTLLIEIIRVGHRRDIYR